MRKITVDGVNYKWSFGTRNVLVLGPDGFKIVMELPAASGGLYTWNDFEEKKASITPSMIEALIKKELSETA